MVDGWGEASANLKYNPMKFEKQRIPHTFPSKIELSHQDYLTFRNGPSLENTGRTVYSQQFDYRSL
jgi:hypothetical protein